MAEHQMGRKHDQLTPAGTALVAQICSLRTDSRRKHPEFAVRLLLTQPDGKVKNLA